MPLEVYHLRLSQSERIVWLLEELKVPYSLHIYDRDLKSSLAPQELKSINPFGTAPYFRDTDVNPPVCLSESGAIFDYVLTVYGPKGAVKLTRTPQDKNYGEYLQWLHFANGSLQPSVTQSMVFLLSGLGDESRLVQILNQRTNDHIKQLDERLAGNKFLAGEELSAADIMTVFSLTTMRGFYHLLDLGPYSNVLRYLKDVAARPAYQQALEKGDHGLSPMIEPRVKCFSQFEIFSQVFNKY